MRFRTLLIIGLAGCSFFKPKSPGPAEKPIARVQNEMLYPSDLEGLITVTTSKNDSALLVEKYVNDWIKKHLMIAAASQSTDLNEAEIERKVLDYRYALIVHSFEKGYIDQNLNGDISELEIQEYYKEKSDNFILKQNLLKCIFAQVPKNAPNISGFRKNIKEYDFNKEDVISYANQFATKAILEDSIWVVFDEMILGTPIEQTSNRSSFLKTTKFSEVSDSSSIYFLYILDYRLIGEISPLEFIEDDISNIIINKRKITLKKELEEKIYEESKEDDLFEIYTD